LPRKTDSNNPADWLYIAGKDLEGVRDLASRELAHAMCLSKLAEVLEKVIKAELVRTGWFLVKTHDLVKLVDELRERDPQTADRFQSLCEELAERYFAGRYPGFDLEDEDWPTLRRQAGEISGLLEMVKERIGPPEA
jgi:HEPN domain-containing protein